MSTILQFPKPRDGAKWFEIKNETEQSADVYIYDVIGDPWVGLDSATVVKQLAGIKSAKINLRINSPGGMVFDGMAIYNALARHSAEVTTYIDGIAASIASVVALAGKRVLIAENAMMMIHNPWAVAMGDASELRKQADVLDQVKETIINTYSTRTGKSREAIGSLMSAETWYTAGDAVANKFADESVAGVKAAACFDLKAFGYVKAPELLHSDESNSATPRSLFHRRHALNEKL